jgi:hypothetical protein
MTGKTQRAFIAASNQSENIFHSLTQKRRAGSRDRHVLQITNR